jgi:hypothetical protein
MGMVELSEESRSDLGRGRRALATLPDVIWGPLAVGSLLLAVGLIGLAAGQPWLFPSLGPTAFLLAERPGQTSARFYNIVVGHLIGLGAGLAAVLLLGASAAPAVLATKELAAVRVWAAVLSAVLTMLGLSILKASHPPAAATMLLVALGGFEPTWHSVGTIIAGVLIVASLGEGVRYVRREVVAPTREIP